MTDGAAAQDPAPLQGSRPRCYVASPLGFSEAGRRYYYETLIPALAQVVTPVDPWALTSDAEIAEARARESLGELVRVMGRRNAEAIRGSTLLVAVLDGQELDSGTAAELGYAAGLGKTCFGLRSDVRETGEEGARVNLQVETFLCDSGGEIAASLAALVDLLRRAVA